MMRNISWGLALSLLMGVSAQADMTNGKELNRFRLRCSFHSDVKGVDSCQAIAQVFKWKKDNAEQSPMPSNNNDRRENRMAVECGKGLIFDGEVELDSGRKKDVLEPEHGNFPRLIVPSLECEQDDETITAFLETAEGTARGFCKVEVKEGHDNF